MNNFKFHKTINICIALVWIVNGLLCKILNLVPRHEQIVAEILDVNYSRLITVMIGTSEMVLAIWILSKYKTKFIAIFQIIIITTMNIIEFIFVPHLLLWGHFNVLFAILFMSLIYFSNFKQKNCYASIS